MKLDKRITALGTVLPGEPNAVDILQDAFDMGLKGIKLHCHVQCVSPDSDCMQDISMTLW